MRKLIHVPYNISSMLSHFLRRKCNKGYVQVTGSCVNYGAGYGMEVPCTYRLAIWTSGIHQLEELVQFLADASS